MRASGSLVVALCLLPQISAYAMEARLLPRPPVAVGEPVELTVECTGASEPLRVAWTIAEERRDGETAQRRHRFATAGRHFIMARVRDADGKVRVATGIQVVHAPLLDAAPRHAGSLAVSADGRRLAVAQPDQGTLAIVDASTGERIAAVPTGAHPAWVCRDVHGRFWVSARDADRLTVVSADGEVTSTIELPYGSRPQGICATPDGAAVLVVLQGRRRLQRYDAATGELRDEVAIGADRFALAVGADRILLTRFRSPDSGGEVAERDLDDLRLRRVWRLPLSPGPDTEARGRGLPNHLLGIAIEPTGNAAHVAAKTDNIERGAARDGLPLTFETSLRAVRCRLDFSAGDETLDRRIDFNDRDAPSAVTCSPLGDVLAIAFQGSNRIACIDTASDELLAEVPVGAAPVGLRFSADGNRLYVHCFLDRGILVLDTSALLAGRGSMLPEVRRIRLVAESDDALPAQVLAGKKLFYTADDRRINLDGYISCASCHRDGGEDRRVWDFTDRGEGLRNTISLRGRRGTGHGRLHWSANFDEVQDFEHDIRGPFGGTGLMDDADFTSEERDRSLGGTKAGASADLDALAAYVTSLDGYPRSPHRAADGASTPAGQRGRAHFERLDCARCHGGDDYTDSATGLLHDVGSLRPSSGQRLGGELPGIDTPTLRGLWNTPPYLHDGSAATVAEVFSEAPADSVHAAPMGLSEAQRADLIAFLLELDGSDAAVARDEDPQP